MKQKASWSETVTAPPTCAFNGGWFAYMLFFATDWISMPEKDDHVLKYIYICLLNHTSAVHRPSKFLSIYLQKHDTITLKARTLE